jgi:hypothetical protein
MVVVVVTAVDLTIVRAFWGSKHHVLSGIALTVLVLNGALFCFIRTRGRARAFWAGFLLAGLLAGGSFVWALIYPKVSATIIDQATAMRVTLHSGGAPLSDQWENYLDFAEESIGNLPSGWNPFVKGGFVELLADACIAFAPQLIVALAGGLLFWLITVLAQASVSAGRRQPKRLAPSGIENSVQ